MASAMVARAEEERRGREGRAGRVSSSTEPIQTRNLSYQFPLGGVAKSSAQRLSKRLAAVRYINAAKLAASRAVRNGTISRGIDVRPPAYRQENARTTTRRASPALFGARDVPIVRNFREFPRTRNDRRPILYFFTTGPSFFEINASHTLSEDISSASVFFVGPALSYRTYISTYSHPVSSLCNARVRLTSGDLSEGRVFIRYGSDDFPGERAIVIASYEIAAIRLRASGYAFAPPPLSTEHDIARSIRQSSVNILTTVTIERAVESVKM